MTSLPQKLLQRSTQMFRLCKRKLGHQQIADQLGDNSPVNQCHSWSPQRLGFRQQWKPFQHQHQRHLQLPHCPPQKLKQDSSWAWLHPEQHQKHR